MNSPQTVFFSRPMNSASWTFNLSVNVRDGIACTEFRNLGGYWNDIWAQILNDVSVIACVEIWRLAPDHHDLQCQRRLQNSGNYMTENREGDSRAKGLGFIVVLGITRPWTLNPFKQQQQQQVLRFNNDFQAGLKILLLLTRFCECNSQQPKPLLLACCEPFKEEDLQLSRHCRITDCNQAMISNLNQVKNLTTYKRTVCVYNDLQISMSETEVPNPDLVICCIGCSRAEEDQ